MNLLLFSTCANYLLSLSHFPWRGESLLTLGRSHLPRRFALLSPVSQLCLPGPLLSLALGIRDGDVQDWDPVSEPSLL